MPHKPHIISSPYRNKFLRKSMNTAGWVNVFTRIRPSHTLIEHNKRRISHTTRSRRIREKKRRKTIFWASRTLQSFWQYNLIQSCQLYFHWHSSTIGNTTSSADQSFLLFCTDWNAVLQQLNRFIPYTDMNGCVDDCI